MDSKRWHSRSARLPVGADRSEKEAPFVSAVGRRTGHFVLEAFIKGGRDWAVFGARRVVGRGPDVAVVKLLRTGSPSPDVARFFDEERRSLASLDHPAIPRLLESGTTRDGWAWFAQDYVIGWPLHRHADERGLGLARRLALMVEVCRAIDHAHDRKVIHPGLRAASLMVTTSGEPKVVGLGLPGLPTGKNLAELGELLFQLARSARPFLGELRDANASRGLAGLSLGGSRPRTDVDRVCLKAVGHGPWDRYRSAGDLADDLERVLAGEPVSARRIPVFARLRNLLERLLGSRPQGVGQTGVAGHRERSQAAR